MERLKLQSIDENYVVRFTKYLSHRVLRIYSSFFFFFFHTARVMNLLFWRKVKVVNDVTEGIQCS